MPAAASTAGWVGGWVGGSVSKQPGRQVGWVGRRRKVVEVEGLGLLLFQLHLLMKQVKGMADDCRAYIIVLVALEQHRQAANRCSSVLLTACTHCVV
jgi:hypothetical protein